MHELLLMDIHFLTVVVSDLGNFPVHGFTRTVLQSLPQGGHIKLLSGSGILQEMDCNHRVVISTNCRIWYSSMHGLPLLAEQ